MLALMMAIVIFMSIGVFFVTGSVLRLELAARSVVSKLNIIPKFLIGWFRSFSLIGSLSLVFISFLIFIGSQFQEYFPLQFQVKLTDGAEAVEVNFGITALILICHCHYFNFTTLLQGAVSRGFSRIFFTWNFYCQSP